MMNKYYLWINGFLATLISLKHLPLKPRTHPASEWNLRRCISLFLIAVTGGCLAACSGPPASAPRNHILEQAWYEDPTGQKGLDAVRALPFLPWQGLLTRGYGEGAVWVRLHMDPGPGSVSKDDRLYLRIRPNYLDEVLLFDPLQGQAPRAPVGDRYPLQNQTEPSTSLMYVLPAGEAPRTLWLRLQTSSTRMVKFEVLDERAMRQSDATITHFSAIYIGLMLMFVLWATLNLILQRDRLMASFLAYKFISLMFGLGLFGYTRFYAPDWLKPQWVDQLTSISSVMATAAALLFSNLLLKSVVAKFYHQLINTVLLLVYPSLTIGILTNHASLSLEINMLMILLMPPLIWLAAILGKVRSESHDFTSAVLPRSFIIAYLSLSLSLTVLAALPSLGLFSISDFSLYIIVFYSVLSGLLMMITLHYRNHLIEKQRHQLNIEAQRQRSLADHARHLREERERLLNMLGHELKTPLSTMRMTMMGDDNVPADTSRKLNSNLLEMTHLIDRTVQTVQLEDDAIPIHLSNCNPVDIAHEAMGKLEHQGRVEIDTRDHSRRDFFVQSDRFLLYVILRNLIDNALAYSPPDSRISIIFMPPEPDGQWNMLIKNEVGQSGVPDAARIFSKYYRSPSASHKTGSGLGLYLVKGLSNKLGGDLRYFFESDMVHFHLTLTQPTGDCA